MDRALLVISATAAEATRVPAGFDVVVTGIGKTAAAAVTTEAILRRGASAVEVVSIGSVGALRDGLSDIFLQSRVVNHDLSADVIRSLGYDPADELTVDDGDGTVLASGDTFVIDAAVRARLAERAHLVDMEGYGVVYACRRLGVPVRLVKHVSDAANEGSLDWATLVEASAVALGDWLAANVSV
jgi:adenosylhomocysteine nucleosidase